MPRGGDPIAMMNLVARIYFDAQLLAAAETVFGLVLAFLLLYLLLEKKKKALIGVIVVLLLGFGGFYWWMGQSRLPVNFHFPARGVKTQTVQAPACVLPPVKAAPAKKIVRRPVVKAVPLPPPPPVQTDTRPICVGPFEFFGCRRL